MALDEHAQLLTVAEAAKLLKVSTVTLRRWLGQGLLPAYHVGPRAVRIRRSDLATVLTPAARKGVNRMKEVLPVQTPLPTAPLSDQEAEQVLAFLERSQALVERMRERRQGTSLPPSWELIRQAREERATRP